jgi:hypothetical protein
MNLERRMEFITKTLADVRVPLRDLGKAQARTDRRMRDLKKFAKKCVLKQAELQREDTRDRAASRKHRGSNGKGH